MRGVTVVTVKPSSFKSIQESSIQCNQIFSSFIHLGKGNFVPERAHPPDLRFYDKLTKASKNILIRKRMIVMQYNIMAMLLTPTVNFFSGSWCTIWSLKVSAIMFLACSSSYSLRDHMLVCCVQYRGCTCTMP